MRSRARTRRESGFTLIELMMTVALIGVMSAIAIPSFLSYQARSRRSEAYVNLVSLARAYKGYYAEAGSFPDMLTESTEPTLPVPPGGLLSAHKMDWDAQTKTFFDIVGWQVEGRVYYSYDVNSANCNGTCSSDNCFTATAHGDVDGDGGWSAVMYVHPQYDADGNPTGDFCPSRVGPPPAGVGLNPPTDSKGNLIYDAAALQLSNDDY